MHNLLIRMTALFYQHRITIKSDIAKELKIKRNVSIVPLGADFRQDRIEQNLDSMKLLYVGTLDHRRIHETIEGLSHFCRSHPDTDVVYTIIGDGKKRYENLLVNQIKLVPTNLTVNYCYVPTTELDSFYQSHIWSILLPIIELLCSNSYKNFRVSTGRMIVIGTHFLFTTSDYKGHELSRRTIPIFRSRHFFRSIRIDIF
jgi:glycosyltransferase involved in cell wall biosynthesis